MLYTLPPCKGKVARAYVNAPINGCPQAFFAYALLVHYPQRKPLSQRGWARVIFHAFAFVVRAGNWGRGPALSRAMAQQAAAYMVKHGLLAAQ